jgi:hypothetical protein
MTREAKLERIAAFESAYCRVDELIAGEGPEALAFVPSLPDAWSINDFLVHFLDADLSLAFRLRLAIAESGMGVPVWDENAWHDALAYGDEDGRACLGLAKGIRAFVAVTLRSRADGDWSAFFIEHPSKGKMDLVALVDLYEQHVAFHLPLIRRNLQAFRKQGSSQARSAASS